MTLKSLAVILVFGLCVFPALAQDATTTVAGQVEVPDRQLLDQASNPTSAIEALSGDTVTVVSFTFTGCTSICPVSDLIMSAVDRAPGDFRIATLTIDPIGDTPETLSRHARELSASGRWRFYTGDPRSVLDVTASLGMDTRSLVDHPAFFLVIGPRMSSVTRLEASASSDDIRQAIALASR